MSKNIDTSGFIKSIKLIVSLSLLMGLYSPAFSQAQKEYSSFTPGGEWLDTEGVHID